MADPHRAAGDEQATDPVDFAAEVRTTGYGFLVSEYDEAATWFGDLTPAQQQAALERIKGCTKRGCMQELRELFLDGLRYAAEAETRLSRAPNGSIQVYDRNGDTYLVTRDIPSCTCRRFRGLPGTMGRRCEHINAVEIVFADPAA